MNRRELIGASGALAISAVLNRGEAQTAPEALTVKLGVIGISFHAVVGGVVQRVLERLGHVVLVSNAPHDQMFDRLGRVEIDVLAAAWMPGTHSHLFTPISDRIERVATVYRDALLYWAVPAYVPAEAVSSVEDLLKPDVAARTDKTIRSIGPSAGLSVRSLRMVPEYGLAATGYAVVPGETADWLQNFRQAYDARRWIVMPLWQPQFLNRTHEVRILRDPKGVMGSADEAVVVANRQFLARLPDRTLRALRAIDIGLAGVTDMDVAVNTRGLTPLAAADEWMTANQDRVSAWIT